MMFRARGKDTNRTMTIDDMLSYRDAYTQPLTDFNFDNIMIEAMRANQPAPPATLVTSENAFRHVDVKTLSDKVQYRRRIQVLLNKLTETNCDILVTEILTPEVLLEDNVSVVVDLIFDKALDEPFFITTYIKLISALAKYETAQEGVNPVTPTSPTSPVSLTAATSSTTASTSRVRRSLVSKAQNTFEEQLYKDKSAMSEEEIDRRRRQEVANVTFVAELLNHNLLAWRVFNSVAQVLFADPPQDAFVELGLKLVTNCGKKIDEGGPEIRGTKKYSPADCFTYINKIAEPVDKPPAGISLRIWFVAKNLVELRSNKWVTKAPKVEVVAPTPAQPAPTKPVATKDLDAAKRARDAQPPEWLTEQLRTDVVKRATKDLIGKNDNEEEGAPAINWDSVISDLGSMKADVLPPVCRRACAFPLIKHFCTTSKDNIRQGLLPLFQQYGSNEVSHAAAWVIADAIMCSDLEDAPKFFDRLALLLTECHQPNIVEVVFARASNFLDALYAENDGEARWGDEYVRAWCLYLTFAKKKDLQLSSADKVLDAFAKYYTSFSADLFPDMITALCNNGFATFDEVAKWIETARRNKNDKVLSTVAALELVF